MEDDYVSENARIRWMERHAAPASVPVRDEQNEEDDSTHDSDEDDSVTGGL